MAPMIVNRKLHQIRPLSRGISLEPEAISAPTSTSCGMILRTHVCFMPNPLSGSSRNRFRSCGFKMVSSFEWLHLHRQLEVVTTIATPIDPHPRHLRPICQPSAIVKNSLPPARTTHVFLAAWAVLPHLPLIALTKCVNSLNE